VELEKSNEQLIGRLRQVKKELDNKIMSRNIDGNVADVSVRKKKIMKKSNNKI